MYWVYEGDNWYASSWYNGPWGVVHRDVVPAFVLRVPVRYYRSPPVYFRGWRADASPRWSVHWGREWEVRRAGWDRWDRRVAYARAPLPLYQRQYVGARYPRAVEQQTNIHITNYNYHPRDTVVRAHFKEQVAKAPPETRRRFEEREAAQAKREAAAKSAPRKREESAKSARDAPAKKSAKETSPAKKEPASKSAKEFAPGQVKREEGAKSAKEFAPGQVKREEGAKSAKEFAPGQQKREQRAPEKGSKSRDDGKGKKSDEERGRGRDK
jgi:flagellar biosynthesis GTPase FlhF